MKVHVYYTHFAIFYKYLGHCLTFICKNKKGLSDISLAMT